MKVTEIITEGKEIRVKWTVPEGKSGRSAEVVVGADPYNSNYLFIKSIDGSNKVTFHASGAEKIIEAIKELTKQS